jgi:alkylated DNA repair dioxygenase AlkB
MSLIPQPNVIIEANHSKVTYQSEFLTSEECKYYFDYFLNNLVWSHDEARIYGKTIITKRKIAWFADKDFDYDYSGISRIAQDWDPQLLEIKTRLELETGHTFNSCLLNLYHNGAEGMAWHSDDQSHLDPEFTTVAIISLGAERFFKLRETPKKSPPAQGVARSDGGIHKVTLEKGSLLLMLDQTQKYWQHEIPKMAAIKEPRISLTWRTMGKSKLIDQK